jgi:serine/threonine protein kinase
MASPSRDHSRSQPSPLNSLWGEGASPAAPAVQEPDERAFDFLNPPQEPDEIGRLANYRVLSVLGQGGMGVVFHAEDLQLQRPVALKLLRPDAVGDLANRLRLLREARAVAAVKSDHIVTIYQVGMDNDMPFLAMELLQGESLDSWLCRGCRPTLPELLRMGRELALGLAAAHSNVG